MPKYTLEPGRCISYDGKPLIYIGRHGSDSKGYAMRPCDTDTMAHIIVNLLNAADIPQTWAVSGIDGISDTDKARETLYHVEACDGCHY